MRKVPSTFKPHARYIPEERAFRCLVCEREGSKPDIEWDPCEIRTHLKEKHGIGIRSQDIEHWTKEFQIERIEYARKRLKNKNEKQIMIVDTEVIVQGKNTREKKKNEKNEERRVLEEQKAKRDS